MFYNLLANAADDAIRTRDIGLGRTTLYQLSYIRIFLIYIILKVSIIQIFY